MSKDERLVLLAAGGTGGHLFPAQALAEALGRRGYAVELATDHRGDRYGQDFPARRVHAISSATVTGKSPLAIAKTGFALARGLRQAHKLIGETKPSVVVGFGGYPSFPPLMAASLRGVPAALHEQNAVLGRANRMLAKRVSAIATSFPEVKFTEDVAGERLVFTGNPVREMALRHVNSAYWQSDEGQPFRLVVFGGSQGARFFSESLPDVIGRLDEGLRARLQLVQQCREEDLSQVQSRYDQLGIAAECAPFFSDLPRRIAESHLVIARSGASTIAELTVIGRPSLLVPLPHSLDNDQLRNATTLAQAGGAWCFRQDELTSERFASELAALMRDSVTLSRAAAAAQTVGRPDAHERLADLVDDLAAGKTPTK